MRALRRRLIRPGARGAPTVVALSLIAGLAAAQDFPITPPGRERKPLPQVEVRPDTADPAEMGPPRVTSLHLLDRFVLPGTRVRLEWQASQGLAGEVPSPVVVVHGAEPGPVLCLTGGVHGDEINGVEIVRRAAYSLDAEKLTGSVIAVPIVNVFGYSRGTRYLPDRRDLNRFFPGSRYGSIASRIARSFFEKIVRHCDALVDVHTGSFDRSNLPQVRADLTDPRVLEFARGFGATVVLHSPGNQGMLRVAATRAGIPAVTFEVGAPLRLQPEEIAAAVEALRRLMHRQGMIDAAAGAAPESAEPQPIFYESRWARADAGGLLISEVQLGQRVQQGQVLGRVIDPVRNSEHEIVAPFFGRVLGMAQNQQVLPGYAVYHLGEETSEQQAVKEAATGAPPSPVAEDAGGGPPEQRDDARAGDEGEEDYE